MEAALTIVSVVIGLYAGWRMLGRSARAVWAAGVALVGRWYEAIRSYVEERRPADHVADTSNMPSPVQFDNRAAQHTDAVQPGTDARTGTVVVQGISRTMKPIEIVAVLAVQRDEQGNHRFSADRIARCVGGTRADVLAQVKAIRGTDERAKQEERTAIIRQEQAKLAEMARRPPPQPSTK